MEEGEPRSSRILENAQHSPWFIDFQELASAGGALGQVSRVSWSRDRVGGEDRSSDGEWHLSPIAILET